MGCGNANGVLCYRNPLVPITLQIHRKDHKSGRLFLNFNKLVPVADYTTMRHIQEPGHQLKSLTFGQHSIVFSR